MTRFIQVVDANEEGHRRFDLWKEWSGDSLQYYYDLEIKLSKVLKDTDMFLGGDGELYKMADVLTKEEKNKGYTMHKEPIKYENS